jgi:hypothetical protein
MAGALVSPGDSIPNALMKFSAPSASPITKSPASSCALNPANEVITCLCGIVFYCKWCFFYN